MPAVDASSSALFTGRTNNITGAFTTGSFNPVGPSILVVCVGSSGPSGANASIASVTNSGTALTWTLIGQENIKLPGEAAAYWAFLGSSQTGFTVTVTSNDPNVFIAVRVYVVTGANTSSPIGGSVVSTSTLNNTTTTAFTTAGASSLGFVVGEDTKDSGTVTSSDTTFTAFENVLDVAGGFGYKTLGALGTSAAFNLTGGSGNNAIWNYVAFEIKAPSGGGGGTTPTPPIPTFSNGTIYHASDLNALGSNLTNLYNYTMSGFRTYKPITVVRISGTAWSPASGSFSTMQFDTVDVDTNGGFDLYLANAGIYSLAVRAAGIYRLYLQFTMPVGTIDTGLTEMHICVNGTNVGTNSVSGTLVGCRATNTHATVGLSVGNTIFGVIEQGTGTAQSASLTYGGNYFAAEWISP